MWYDFLFFFFYFLICCFSAIGYPNYFATDFQWNDFFLSFLTMWAMMMTRTTRETGTKCMHHYFLLPLFCWEAAVGLSSIRRWAFNHSSLYIIIHTTHVHINMNNIHCTIYALVIPNNSFSYNTKICIILYNVMWMYLCIAETGCYFIIIEIL